VLGRLLIRALNPIIPMAYRNQYGQVRAGSFPSRLTGSRAFGGNGGMPGWEIFCMGLLSAECQ